MVFGLTKKRQIAEHEAEGAIERVYHEVRQTLRVSGVNLIFRTLARYDKFLPAMWETLRPNAVTRVFEDAADSVRAHAVTEADAMDRLNVPVNVRLGESQIYQIKAALDLYHYINPKLLVLISAMRHALTGGFVREEVEGAKFLEQIERGIPSRMYPMEMVSDEPKDERLSELFEDMKETLSLPSINSDYRTLALWPDYLAEAWHRLKPLVRRQEYLEAAEKIRVLARDGARELPYPILSRERLNELGEDVEEIGGVIEKFEDILAPLIVNIALLELDFHDRQRLMNSPFPAAAL
jgi:hypothetical protein